MAKRVYDFEKEFAQAQARPPIVGLKLQKPRGNGAAWIVSIRTYGVLKNSYYGFNKLRPEAWAYKQAVEYLYWLRVQLGQADRPGSTRRWYRRCTKRTEGDTGYAGGIPGISRHEKNGNPIYRAVWTTEEGKVLTLTRAVKKYGEAQAFELVVAFRRKLEAEYKEKHPALSLTSALANSPSASSGGQYAS